MYKLLNPEGDPYLSPTPGSIGGHKKLKIYGRLDCPSAARFLSRGLYAKHRVFFQDEESAIAAGFRPCARCMPDRYTQWARGGTTHTTDYPWHIYPQHIRHNWQNLRADLINEMRALDNVGLLDDLDLYSLSDTELELLNSELQEYAHNRMRAMMGEERYAKYILDIKRFKHEN